MKAVRCRGGMTLNQHCVWEGDFPQHLCRVQPLLWRKARLSGKSRRLEDSVNGGWYCQSWKINVKGINFLRTCIAQQERRIIRGKSCPGIEKSRSPDLF